jgi:hypothetical protein
MAGDVVSATLGELEDERAPVTTARARGYEYRSRLKLGSLPLVHIVRGVDPSTGTRPPAIGVIAVGQVAVGAIAIGQVAVGGIAIGQAALGLGWGVGQLGVGLLAAGQVAIGALGALGQVALGARPLGLIEGHGPWAALAWLLGAIALLGWLALRLRMLGPIVGRGTGAFAALAGLRDGHARVSARVISENHLRAPLSSRPCVYWHAVRVGPGIWAEEKSGQSITIADDSGTARVDLQGATMFIRNERYSELPAPDWSLHMETYLGQGDQLFVAGPVHLQPDTDGQNPYRGGGLMPVFRGTAAHPVVVTTRSPDLMTSELKLASVMAGALILFAMVHLGQSAAAAALSALTGG